MDMDFKVAEETLQYKPTCKKQGKVMSSEAAYKILFPISETAVDVRMILQGALLTNASQILLYHNHPSGNLHPSTQDDILTRRIKEACEILRYHFTDHLIISNNGYYSYRNEGRI